jgi:hypothetical protein
MFTEEYYILGYNAMYSDHRESRWQAELCFHADFLLGLFYPEDRGDMFLRNVGSFSMDYTSLYPRR